MWKGIRTYESRTFRRLRYNICCDTTRLYTSLSLKLYDWPL